MVNIHYGMESKDFVIFGSSPLLFVQKKKHPKREMAERKQKENPIKISAETIKLIINSFTNWIPNESNYLLFNVRKTVGKEYIKMNGILWMPEIGKNTRKKWKTES